MKRIIRVASFCIMLLFILFPAACAKRDEDAPSGVAIDRAVSWAESLVGKDSFPWATRNEDSPALFMCARFTASAYGSEGLPYNAYTIWTFLNQHPGDWDAPRGSLVFFDQNLYNGEMGHVALCMGNGNLIEAGPFNITKSTIREEDKGAPYLGWAWPPYSWSGRKDGPVPMPAVWVIVACAAVIALGDGAFLFFRKKKQPIGTKAP